MASFGNLRAVNRRSGGGLGWDAEGWIDESISAGSIVAWRKWVAVGKRFVFSEKWQNVGVTAS